MTHKGTVLQEPGLVDHEHPARVAQVLDHVGARVIVECIGVPTPTLHLARKRAD
jgi:hypothetical protein